MGHGFVFYCVITPEGQPAKRASGTYKIHGDLGAAKRACREGDAVVEMALDLAREPLYIRGRKVVDKEPTGD